MKQEVNINAKGQVTYESPEDLDPKEDKYCYRAIGSSLLNTICPAEVKDTEEYSTSLDSSKMDYNELMMLLRGVENPIMVRQAFRLLLMFTRCSYNDISK